ncbi:MAG: hypothetical protein DRH17_12895 [Deltaproteobacteria bacterium]|nr:MAG: hypothetical protein DRH17_12895 [Deltaproteobacteria bacterium]
MRVIFGVVMPSANVTQLPIVVYVRSGNLFHYYNGKLYDIELLVDAVKIVNCTDKTAQELSTGLSSDLTPYVRIIDLKHKTNSTIVVRAIYIKSGYVVIVRYEIDLSAMTVNVVEEQSYNLTWISAREELQHSAVIPPYLWVAPNKEDSYLHYVNIDNGNDVSFDAGLGGYFASSSTKYVALNDDIYMMLGRHYSGSPVYLLKLYSKSASSTGVSAGGGSPRSQIGSITLFYNDVIFPCGWGGVSGTDNDIALFDHRMNHLGTLDLSALTGWGDVDTMPGFTILAKKTDGKYYALLAVRHSSGSGSPQGRLYWLELQRNGTIVSSSLLHTFAMDDGDKLRVQIKGDYSDRTCVPCIDLRSKKVYATAFDVEGGTSKSWLVEIDISDVWDNIAEWNRALWFISPLRIPTTLTLSVTPL